MQLTFVIAHLAARGGHVAMVQQGQHSCCTAMHCCYVQGPEALLVGCIHSCTHTEQLLNNCCMVVLCCDVQGHAAILVGCIYGRTGTEHLTVMTATRPCTRQHARDMRGLCSCC